MATKSKVLVIGATGYIGKLIALAAPKEGHPTYAFIRPETLNSKPELIESLKASGVNVLQGSIDDHESLVAAFKQVDVIISTVGSTQITDQVKIIAAIKEAGNIKRFFPSEFGNDVNRTHALGPAKTFLSLKAQIQRAVEEAGIPYTYVVSHGFAGFFLKNLFQSGLTSPPKDKVKIFGTGDVKFISVVEKDIATYTIKAVDDPRTFNKTLHIRPSGNTVTLNELVALWEKKIGKTLEKEIVTKEQVEKEIQETPFPGNVLPALVHSILILGDHFNYELGADDVEATSLYPDVKYVSADEYLSQFV